jgi:hypothetical protein
MSTSPQMNVRLIGEELITTFNETITWTPVSKLENTLVINSGSGSKTVDLTNISNLRLITFFGDGNYQITITVGYDVLTFESRDFFIFSPTTTYGPTITSIAISTTSSSNVSVEIRCYGE